MTPETDPDRGESGGPRSADRSERADERPPERAFGWRGWLLVGALVVSLLVVPWTIILVQSAQGLLESLGLGLRDAYLVLPMVPAVLLGAVAVWTAIANRERRR